MRADPELAEIPIIMITSLDDRDSCLEGIEAGGAEDGSALGQDTGNVAVFEGPEGFGHEPPVAVEDADQALDDAETYFAVSNSRVIPS